MEGESGFSIQSVWISRFLKSKGSPGPPPGMRRSFSCSSVPSQGEADFLVPQSFKRSQLADSDDELDGDSFQRFLRSHRSSPLQWASSPRTPRQLCVSLDRGTFISSGYVSSKCKTSSSTESVPQKIIRGFEKGGSSSDDWTLKLETEAPLPYSSYEDQKSGRKAHKPRPRKGLEAGQSESFRCHAGEQRTGLASLLTPIPLPADLIKTWQGESSASSNHGTFHRVHQMMRRASQRDDEFVHELSVLSRQHCCYLNRQQQVQQQQVSSEWINRWSFPGDENEETLLRLRSAYVPSAKAMAIVGKSSLDVHPNSSWSNSITSWQCSKRS